MSNASGGCPKRKQWVKFVTLVGKMHRLQRSDSYRLGLWISTLMMILAGLFPVGCTRRARTGKPPPVTEPVEHLAVRSSRPDLVVFLVDERAGGGRVWMVWEATEADSVVIDNGIGEVLPSGRIQLSPTISVTYRVSARGPGGQTEHEVRVESDHSVDQKFSRSMEPVYFRFGSLKLDEHGLSILDENIAWLILPRNRSVTILVKGYSDPRSTNQYGHALADARGLVIRKYMIERGISPDRIQAVSMGEEPDQDEHKGESRDRAEFLVSR